MGQLRKTLQLSGAWQLRWVLPWGLPWGLCARGKEAASPAAGVEVGWPTARAAVALGLATLGLTRLCGRHLVQAVVAVHGLTTLCGRHLGQAVVAVHGLTTLCGRHLGQAVVAVDPMNARYLSGYAFSE